MGDDQYRAPSSTDRYGGFIADPYTHVGSADEAVEAGRVVEVSLEKISVRALEESELSPDVQSVIDGESGSVVAILTEASRTRTQLVLLRVLAELDDGSIMEADACSEYEYPAEVGVDPKVAAGLFCFGTDLDPTATIRVAEGRNGNGLPIAAPLLD